MKNLLLVILFLLPFIAKAQSSEFHYKAEDRYLYYGNVMEVDSSFAVAYLYKSFCWSGFAIRFFELWICDPIYQKNLLFTTSIQNQHRNKKNPTSQPDFPIIPNVPDPKKIPIIFRRIKFSLIVRGEIYRNKLSIEQALSFVPNTCINSTYKNRKFT